MFLNKHFIWDRFARIEVVFFLVYFFLFNIITDVEYNLYENHNYVLFIKEVPSRLIYGVVYIIPFWICYKTLIQGYLFQKKYLKFFLLLLGFLVMLNFYFLYSYWLISKLKFLPAKVVADANVYYHSKVMIRFSLMYIFRELLVISSLAYFIKSVKQEKLMSAIRQEQLQAELKYLKVQVQPHFFFNTLNNIYALTLQGSVEAAPLVAKHADMMRYILYEASNYKVGLQQEVDFLQNYAQVEAVRHAGRISVGFDTQGINNTVMIEPLLLLPFIENAFKHGASDAITTGYINMLVCMVEDELILEVKNSKPFVRSNSNTEPGIGLLNINRRLALLYPQKHLLEIDETETDYEMRLTLQLSSNG